MTDQAVENQSEASLGQTLRLARERQGMSTQDLAKTLNIQLDKLVYLEADEYDKLFSPVFVRGYIRSCAKLLHLDAEPLVAKFDAEYKEQEPLPQAESLNVEMTNARNVWLRRILLVLIILVVWGAVYWYFGGNSTATAENTSSAEQSTSSQSGSDSVGANSVDATVAGESRQDQAGAGLNVSGASPVSALPSSTVTMPQAATDAGANDAAMSSDESGGENLSLDTESSADTSQVASAVQPESSQVGGGASAVAGIDQLRFVFTADCWISVNDASGENLLSDLRSAGSQIELSGEAPFEITLGNSAGAEMWLNGESWPIPVIGDGDVARFVAGTGNSE